MLQSNFFFYFLVLSFGSIPFLLYFNMKKRKQTRKNEKLTSFQNQNDSLKMIQNYLNQITENSIHDYCIGSIFGQLIGDALGSFLEFQDWVSNNQLNDALKMLGGGPFSLEPGQITDDSELAIQLLTALTNSITFDDKEIANEYVKWFKSFPFDIGYTTESAFTHINNQNLSNKDAMIKASQEMNSKSLSNGCLMRISPLGIYTALMQSPQQDVFNFAERDTQLTHSHPSAIKAVQIWVLTLQQLILRKEKNHLIVYKEIVNKFKSEQDSVIKEFFDRIENGQNYPFNQQIGYLGISFVAGFKFLNQPSLSFYGIMQEILSQGGDTDTNACIIGAMVGSVIGFKAMQRDPKVSNWIQKVLNCESTLRAQFRPSFAVEKTIQLIRQYGGR